MIVGIDLGTTYSAVAIPEVRSGEGYFSLPSCPGYTLLLDNHRRRITPSVVAEDEKGNIVVGYQAKQRAGMSPEPIMFAKRWMGEEKTFPLKKQGNLRPLDVSRYVLQYLKDMAEKRLGEPVKEAVVTVPAYFSIAAKQATQEAAELAGLRVAQIAQEPVAAAIMYCLNDPRDPLRVMTYDLGGGTFDISILEKRDGTISTASMLAFEGDRFLGGYNFDKRIADWLLEGLIARGFDFTPGMRDSRDREIFAKLMVAAERIKIELSRQELFQFIDHNTNIVDRRGEPVTFEMDIHRAQFEDMIRPYIEQTVELCHKARSTKDGRPIPIDSLHEILMVGGSSRIPLVRARLREEFGREPLLVEPDLCVALGAAMIAGTLPKTVGCLRLGNIPRETDLTALEVSGQVVVSSGLPSVAGCGVALRSMDGAWQASRTTKDDGSFLFQNVKLVKGEATDFTLSVTSSAGQEAAKHRFSVLQTENPSDQGQIQISPNVLSKSISILWADGDEVIAAAKSPLPFVTKGIRAVTTDTSGAVRAVVLEGSNPIGEMVMSGIPKTLPAGSHVDVKLTIRGDYTIEGKMVIVALSMEGPVSIRIPARKHKTVSELSEDLRVLEAKAEDALSSAGANVLFGDGRGQRLQGKIEACKAMLTQEEPERIQDYLDEINTLIRDINQGWKPQPSRATFDGAASDARRLYSQTRARKPEIAKDKFEERIDLICKEADKAFVAQNGAAWKESYERMERVCDQLEELGRVPPPTPSGDGPEPPPPNPAAIKAQCAEALRGLHASLKREPARYEAFKAEIAVLSGALDRIDPKAQDARSQLQDWYFTRLADLKMRSEEWVEEKRGPNLERSK